MLPYVQPGQLIAIGGRHINMHCAGSGRPTVILMAGLFSWSVVWYKTQPVIAQKTRVCAFDRAAVERESSDALEELGKKKAATPYIEKDVTLGAPLLARCAPVHQGVRSRDSVG